MLLIITVAVVAAIASVAVFDLIQRRHAILRNFPVIGHFRYWLEAVGPELRQYIVTDNNEERPFSRDLDGRFSMPRLKELLDRYPQVRAIEIKLSQGAKPGIGGVLPRRKLAEEIAEIRGVPLTRDCISPASHSAFRDASSLLDFVECLAAETGLPVGIKSAVGEMAFWRNLTRLIATTKRSVDFVTVDGGEGGTGAAPLVFADRVGLPFKIGFSRVQYAFAEHGLHERIVFIGSGKLGFPEAALLAFSLGCDMVNVGREALLAIGCIQALRCHTNHCPTGVTTQNWWLTRGLDPKLKSVRLANYIVSLGKELLALSHACGVDHPSKITADQIEILDDRFGARAVSEVFGGRGQGSAEGIHPLTVTRRTSGSVGSVA